MAGRIGQQLGNYNITQLLGQGGFAEVYLGEHVYLRTQAAIKVLQTRLSGPEDIDSFLNEARTIARLSHPHIIRVLDFGIDKETPFLVMDYAPNGTLHQRHPRGTPLPLTTIVPYVKQIADALQYAHDEKLIHRDIKPENMLIGRRNDILLSDFGIALVAQSSRYQSTQDVIGTVAYMSPEQIQGKPRPASDQYSLGIVVYEWLSGGRPFNGSFTELCTQHMFAPPPPLHEKIATISPAVEQVVMIALAKEPKQRFGSVQAFANALEQASKAAQENVSQKPSSMSLPISATPTLPPQPEHNQPPTIQPVSAASILPPTQYVEQPSSLVSPAQYMAPSYGSGTTSPQGIQEEARGDKIRVWSLGRRQIIAMIVATLIYGIFDYIAGRVATTNPEFFFNPIGNNAYLPSFYGIMSGLIITIPFFFGAEFGPLVGLTSIFIGGLAGDYLAGLISYDVFNWYIYVIFPFLGLFPGLALPITRGQYATSRSIIIAIVMSALGIIIVSIILSIASEINYRDNLFNLVTGFISNVLTNVPALIILPPLLFEYNKIVKRK